MLLKINLNLTISHSFNSIYVQWICRGQNRGISILSTTDTPYTKRTKVFVHPKYPCTDSTIYRLNIQLGAKLGIEIHKYRKFIVLALTLVKFLIF